MGGAEQIKMERKRQIRKRYDDSKNNDCQLAECAGYIIGDYIEDVATSAENYDWPTQRAIRVKSKYGRDYVARLRIAGALIAAEIDKVESKKEMDAIKRRKKKS